MARAASRSVGIVAALGIVYFFGLSGLLRAAAPAGNSVVYVVTPTHDRLTRFAALVSLGQALALAATRTNILWLVVEDADELDPAVSRLLADLRVPHEYFTSHTSGKGEHRGVQQRNAALDLIQQRAQAGVVYFADDDNTIRSELVSRLARIPRDSFTVFPVGNQGYFGLEGPVVDTSHATDTSAQARIVQWCCDLCRRRWNVDMAGLAFHSSVLTLSPRLAIRFSHESEPGFLETDVLSLVEDTGAQFVLSQQLVDAVYVWHDSTAPTAVAAFYDADWVTSAVLARRPESKEQIVRGFSWAQDSLPSATWVP
ncbi:hypothetical protein ACM66B_003301 [Microbotryomycetes sp. NB124-2]